VCGERVHCFGRPAGPEVVTRPRETLRALRVTLCLRLLDRSVDLADGCPGALTSSFGRVRVPTASGGPGLRSFVVIAFLGGRVGDCFGGIG